MGTMEIGRKLVSLCQESRNLEALDTLFDKDAVNIEAMSMPPGRWRRSRAGPRAP